MSKYAPGDHERHRLIVARATGIVGAFFGLLTLREGGAVLFFDGTARAAAGDFVPFVLWFNFLAGFLYVAAGIGLFYRKPWVARLAIFIALATLVTFAAFVAHVLGGGASEARTFVALTIRSAVWSAIAVLGWRVLLRTPSSPTGTKEIYQS